MWYATCTYCIIRCILCDTLRTTCTCIWYAAYCGIHCSVWFPVYWAVIVFLQILILLSWTFPCTLTFWPTLHLYWPLHTLPWKWIILNKEVCEASVTHTIFFHMFGILYINMCMLPPFISYTCMYAAHMCIHARQIAWIFPALTINLVICNTYIAHVPKPLVQLCKDFWCSPPRSVGIMNMITLSVSMQCHTHTQFT